MPPLIEPPTSEAELLARARALAGRTLGELAERAATVAPPDLRRHKGWIGQLLEALLGATAGSAQAPDFEGLGIELKTLPVRADGRPRESTYVCVAPMTDLAAITWETCWLRAKLARVLWVPIEVAAGRALAERRVGMPLLWSPSPEEARALRADWEELTDAIRMGRVDEVTGHVGEVLQLRPKAAHSGITGAGVGPDGRAALTLPRGFYLRASFTAALLRRHFALPAG